MQKIPRIYQIILHSNNNTQNKKIVYEYHNNARKYIVNIQKHTIMHREDRCATNTERYQRPH